MCQGDPVRVSMCHCLECQRRTGSPFGVQAWFSRDEVRLVTRADKSYARKGDSGRVVTFPFCPECGGTVFWEAEQRPDLIAVAVGMFADPDFEGASSLGLGKKTTSLDNRDRRPANRTFGLERAFGSKTRLICLASNDARRAPTSAA
jgi:hypothetical protein